MFCSLSVYIGFTLFVLPETTRRLFYDRLAGKKISCLLAEPTRRRSVLPVCASPRRLAARRIVPIRFSNEGSNESDFQGIYNILFLIPFKGKRKTLYKCVLKGGVDKI